MQRNGINAVAWFYRQSFAGRSQVSSSTPSAPPVHPFSMATQADKGAGALSSPALETSESWPIPEWGKIRGLLLSLNWAEAEDKFFFDHGRWCVYFCAGKFWLVEDADWQYLVERGKGTTRNELIEALMEVDLMREDGDGAADILELAKGAIE